jgi:hypothetical protein
MSEANRRPPKKRKLPSSIGTTGPATKPSSTGRADTAPRAGTGTGRIVTLADPHHGAPVQHGAGRWHGVFTQMQMAAMGRVDSHDGYNFPAGVDPLAVVRAGADGDAAVYGVSHATGYDVTVSGRADTRDIPVHRQRRGHRARQIFDTAANRDAAIPVPQVGQTREP